MPKVPYPKVPKVPKGPNIPKVHIGEDQVKDAILKVQIMRPKYIMSPNKIRVHKRGR